MCERINKAEKKISVDEGVSCGKKESSKALVAPGNLVTFYNQDVFPNVYARLKMFQPKEGTGRHPQSVKHEYDKEQLYKQSDVRCFGRNLYVPDKSNEEGFFRLPEDCGKYHDALKDSGVSTKNRTKELDECRAEKKEETEFHREKVRAECGFSLHQLISSSLNKYMFVMEPRPTTGTGKSFIKKLKNIRYNKNPNFLPLKDWYPPLYAYAITQNTTRHLQEQEYYFEENNPNMPSGRWVVSEWVGGTTLRDLTEGSTEAWKMNPKKKIELVIEFLRAVATFHCGGYIHGDLHLGNIKIDQNGILRIFDYDMVQSSTHWNSWYGKEEKHRIKFAARKILLGHGNMDEDECFEREAEKFLREKLPTMLNDKHEHLGPSYCNDFEKGLFTAEELFVFLCN
jgi:serine/threonine protein kinase